MQARKIPEQQPGVAQRRAAGLLLCVLGSVVAVVFWVQRTPHEATEYAVNPGISSVRVKSAALLDLENGIWTPMGGEEHYDKESLADKIDGKAELYLPAGFVDMACRRFALNRNSSVWMELFLYDMGAPAGAIAVYSQQKRSDSLSTRLSHAYATANALFAYRGRYYVEAVCSSTGVVGDLEKLVENLFLRLPADEGLLEQADGKWPSGTDEQNEQLIVSDALGCAFFDQFYLAPYTGGGLPVTIYRSDRAAPDEAQGLIQRYTGMMKQIGAKISPWREQPGAYALELFDLHGIIFSAGAVIAGVNEAPDKDQADQAAEVLLKHLSK